MSANNPSLDRVIGLSGAIMMGLGSILGTGIFVSIGLASGVSGPSVLLALILAALVASCNALSSAELAASHPLSGGTYEYGYRYLHPTLGFTAGWMFLSAKTASAATAALGFAGYFLHLIGFSEIPITFVALLIVILITLLALSGMKRSNKMNALIVAITLLSLLAFIIFGFLGLSKTNLQNLSPFFPQDGYGNLFYATALMFVSYTGYGRIATLGEEVKDPEIIIPKAIILTLIISALLYILVAFVAIAKVGSTLLAATTQSQATPLEIAAMAINSSFIAPLVALGACTAMLSVLLNLSLGLSRVCLAMGRQRDLPELFSYISKNGTPSVSVIAVGLAIFCFVLFGSVELTWSFSAFTVLIYYSITNLSALFLPKEKQKYPRWIAVIGLISCLFLAFWVPLKIWLAGLLLILMGLIWHFFHRYYLRKS